MISDQELMQNPDMLGDYNVAKYVANFNKKVEPLLVAFNPNMNFVVTGENKGVSITPQLKTVYTIKEKVGISWCSACGKRLSVIPSARVEFAICSIAFRINLSSPELYKLTIACMRVSPTYCSCS